MLLAVRNLTKSYGAITVLHTISFVVSPSDRIGIVGSNGVGKSTLLRILVGQEELDSGSISFGPAVEYGYLPQTTPSFEGHTIENLIQEAVGNLRQLETQMHQLEEQMASAQDDALTTLLETYNDVSTKFQDRGGYEIDYKIDTILAGLRIAYLPRSQAVDTLSGGEKARVGLAALLLRSPDILLLDEPTNHLDFATMEWLENYLSSYRGAVLMVSHDRQFLNRSVTHIFEIDEHEHHLHQYTGNYDAYVTAKAVARATWEAEYERQQEEIQELRKRIKVTGRTIGHVGRKPRDNDKFARYFFTQNVQSAVSRNVRAAEVQLQRIEDDPIPKPPTELSITSHFNNAEAMHSQIVLRLSHVSMNFGQRSLFSDVHLTLEPHARIMLVGPNGTGKTTLFRLIMGELQPAGGSIYLAPEARIGYLAQEPDSLPLDATVIEAYRYDQVGYESEFIGRLLGYGLFRLEDIHKTVRQLSIGQRRKLEIARLMAQNPNILLLDEPTNYISLDVLEAFEAAVLAFPGPVVTISHDRWFLQRFKGQFWELRDGHLVQHEDAIFTFS